MPGEQPPSDVKSLLRDAERLAAAAAGAGLTISGLRRDTRKAPPFRALAANGLAVTVEPAPAGGCWLGIAPTIYSQGLNAGVRAAALRAAADAAARVEDGWRRSEDGLSTESELESAREFLKDHVRQRIDFRTTDQNRGLPPPPIEKPFPPASERISLVAPGSWQGIGKVDLESAIRDRRSRRQYAPTALRLDELSFLLWATQGMRKRLNAGTALRTVPSAGARHALETYLCVLRVADLPAGVYRYLPLEHELVCVDSVKDLPDRVTAATLGQTFAGQAAAVFAWAAVPKRMEWRYALASHKVIALDAGHVCQNLYLACEAIGAGTCAIAAYDQDAMDRLLGVDGTDEFVVYLAPVGKVSAGQPA